MELESNSNNIKLDSSKKGTATVNYIRGNTLVNCAKENKELILNDEINVEGTTCTINDTVEGGLVDVELEGLSLNNLYKVTTKKPADNNKICWNYDKDNSIALLSNTTVTAINKTGRKIILDVNSKEANAWARSVILMPSDIYKVITLTQDEYIGVLYGQISDGWGTTDSDYELLKSTCMIFQGDYTNKPIPTESFTGIKSVGEEVTLTNLVSEVGSIGSGNPAFSTEGDLFKSVTIAEGSNIFKLLLDSVKTSTIITLKVSLDINNDYDSLNYGYWDNGKFTVVGTLVKGLNEIVFNYAPENGYVWVGRTNSLKVGTAITMSKPIIVEGDYENSNLEHFEGSIKKYKIETKSQNKNFVEVSQPKVRYIWQSECTILPNGGIEVRPTTTTGVSYVRLGNYKLKKGNRYKFNPNGSGFNGQGVVWLGNTLVHEYIEADISKPLEKDIVVDIGLYVDNSSLDNVATFYPQIEVGEVATSQVAHKHHKKVILLDEPLRGIEGGAKDKTLKRESKLYLKRNFKEVEFKGLSSESWGLATTIEVEDTCYFTMQISDRKFMLELLCNKFTNIDVYNNNVEGIRGYTGSNHIGIRILKSKLETADVDGFKKWLQANPVTVVYQLVTPVYEEIKGLDNEFPTYAEVTHISTNTVIPCNQKIQNTGIECMLKPSTLYSIHDIRTGSGTAKYNLGGTINTSNKITTGATLTDNYLRLYGKGLTLKDVEVFEGDTPQTPYFSGMLSAFEDKKITQEMVDSGLEKADNLGKYRVGIKVVGKNKFDSTKVTWQDNSRIGAHGGIYESTGMSCSNIIKNPFLPGVKISCNASCIAFYSNDKENSMISREYNKVNINVPSNAKYIRLEIKTTDKNTAQLEEGTVVTQYEPYKEYKTSILLSSPLLKGDGICVNEGKLCHYHKVKQGAFDGSDDENWSINSTKTIAYLSPNPSIKNLGEIMCDKLSVRNIGDIYVDGNMGIGSSSSENKFGIGTMGMSTSVEIKSWLSQNTINVAYELAEPYFEPITPQLPRWVLDIFDNSTISIDTIIPVESKFTYTSYIPSIPAMQETNKNQDDLINVSLCATDEMYMMLEPLLQSVPQTLRINERMVSKMGELYIAMVLRKLKNIDDVPVAYRDYVIAKLNK